MDSRKAARLFMHRMPPYQLQRRENKGGTERVLLHETPPKCFYCGSKDPLKWYWCSVMRRLSCSKCTRKGKAMWCEKNVTQHNHWLIDKLEESERITWSMQTPQGL